MSDFDSFEDVLGFAEDGAFPVAWTLEQAYLIGRQDARKEIADSNGGDDTAYRLSYGDGSFHTKVYRTRGLARAARKMMGEPRSNELRIQELKGVWVTVE